MKHSPGPWKLTYYEGAFDHKINDANDDLLLDGDEFLTSVPVEKDDWLLIAAAPELLEALEDTMRWINDLEFNEDQIVKKLTAVIKKAKGE